MRRNTSVRKPIVNDFALLGVVLIWSLNFTAGKVGVAAFTPLGYALLRFVLGASLTIAVLVWREGFPHFRVSDLPLLSVTAICGVTINQTTFALSLHLTSASNVALVIGSAPLWTALIALVSHQESVAVRHWLAVSSGILGTALVILGGVQAGGGAYFYGGALALIAAISWATYSVFIRPLMLRYSALQLSGFMVVVGALTIVPFGLPDLVRVDWVAVSPNAWLAVLYSGVLAVALTNVLYFAAIAGLGASRASLYMYLEPFLGVLFAFLILREGITWTQIAGGLIIAASLMLGRRRAAARLGTVP